MQNSNETITIGLDVTTKPGGHKLYNIKADYITVAGPKGRKVWTTGYTENISHAEQDDADDYSFELK